jgi:adenylate cyclase
VTLLVERLDSPATLSRARSQRENDTVQFAQAALASGKQEGLQLAVRARYVALAVIACLLPAINPAWEQLYYVALLGLFALIGWAQVRVGRVGVSRSELALLFCDLALLTFVIIVPNPFGTTHWPAAMQYHFGNFIYFFVLLSGATLAYSWRTVVAVGIWTAALWVIGVAWVWWQPDRDPALTARIADAVGSDHRLFALISPAAIGFGLRIQEIVVFMIVAVTLALAVRRSNDLLIRHAAVERERGNLARYFSPNVVTELSKHDEPLKQVRTQDVAVLFVDIVGFTAFADVRLPEEVVRTLREFHGLMEQEVFRHDGTLDKYLGDGLMATFGTPFAGTRDASNAFRRAPYARQLWPALRAGGARRHRAHLSGICRDRRDRQRCKPPRSTDAHARLRAGGKPRSRQPRQAGTRQHSRDICIVDRPGSPSDPRARAADRDLDPTARDAVGKVRPLCWITPPTKCPANRPGS